MKRCPECGVSKPSSEFYRNAKGRLSGYCKPCAIARSGKWQRENPKRAAAAKHAWYERNIEYMREFNRNQTYSSEKSVPYMRKWRARNPERVKVYAQRSNLRRRAGGLDSATREYILVIRDDPCSYCGGPGGEIDHIVPFDSGGASDWSNLTAACRSCNARKQTSSVLAFLKR